MKRVSFNIFNAVSCIAYKNSEEIYLLSSCTRKKFLKMNNYITSLGVFWWSLIQLLFKGIYNIWWNLLLICPLMIPLLEKSSVRDLWLVVKKLAGHNVFQQQNTVNPIVQKKIKRLTVEIVWVKTCTILKLFKFRMNCLNFQNFLIDIVFINRRCIH